MRRLLTVVGTLVAVCSLITVAAGQVWKGDLRNIVSLYAKSAVILTLPYMTLSVALYN